MFLSSCGYNPLYLNKDFKKFTFSEIELIGNKKINRKIISSLSLKKDEQTNIDNKISIDSNKEIIETSKNSEGQVTSYRMIIKVVIKIEEDDNTFKTKGFTKDFSYNNKDNKFDLAEYQNQVETNLINKIIEELIIYINL
tara:strand:- start:281 stop:700 length:420 start_codon:yes stop_codon:yes gene_type:complete